MERQSLHVLFLAIVIAILSRVNGIYANITPLPCNPSAQGMTFSISNLGKLHHCWNTTRSTMPTMLDQCKHYNPCSYTSVNWVGGTCDDFGRKESTMPPYIIDSTGNCSPKEKIVLFMKYEPCMYRFENLSSFGFALGIQKPSMSKNYVVHFESSTDVYATLKLGDVFLSGMKQVSLLDSADIDMPSKSHLFLQLKLKPEQLAFHKPLIVSARLTTSDNRNVSTFLEVNGKDRAMSHFVRAGISFKKLFEATAVAQLSPHCRTESPRTTIDVDVLAYFVEPNCELEPDEELERNPDAWFPNCTKINILDSEKEGKESVDSENEGREPLDSENEEREPLDNENEEREPLDSENEEREPLDSENEEWEPLDSENERREPLDSKNKRKEPLDRKNKEKEPLDRKNKEKELLDSENKRSKPLDSENKKKKTTHPAPAWFDSELTSKVILLLRRVNAYFKQMETEDPKTSKTPTPPKTSV